MVTYQQTVLQAAQEVEDGLVTFLLSQQSTRHLEKSVGAANNAFKDLFLPVSLGQPGFDFNRFALIQQNRITQQDQLAQSRGQIDQGLIQVYRALGGGWEIRRQPAPEVPPPPETPPSVVPEGEKEMQKLRDLLEPQAGGNAPLPESLPKPKAEPPKP